MLAKAVAHVHAAGGRVAVHAVCPEALDAAVAAGVDSVEHGWAVTDAARLGRRLGDPRHVTWQEEALATAQRCGMRALASQLLPDADST